MNRLKFIFSYIIQCLRLCFKITSVILTFTPKLLKSIAHKINKRLRFSISFKMTAVYTLIFSIILFLLSVSLIIGFKLFLLKDVQSELTKYSTIAANYSKSNKNLQNFNINIFSNMKYISLSVFDEKGNIILTSLKNRKNVSFYKDNSHSPVINDINQQFLFVTTKLTLNNKMVFLQFSKNLEKENLCWYVFAFIIFIINILSLIITLKIGSKTSKKMLLPIINMTETTKAISINALGKRLDVSNSHDELKQLAETFNDMLNRIQSSYEIQNQFVSDASHELRTPIAVIQGYINMLYRWGKNDKKVLLESIIAIKDESENMKELVEKLLFLARSDKNTQKICKKGFYINILIDDIIKETKLIDTEHEISTTINEKSLIYADKKLLKQALRIFIDNSIKYTPNGGTIKINEYVKDKKIIVEIIDSGIGIQKKDLPYIFNRFYRCDKSRAKNSGGNGLGLSIAKWIIGMHHGNIVVESRLNVGTKLIIEFPIEKNN